jgi:hypothetical protein
MKAPKIGNLYKVKRSTQINKVEVMYKEEANERLDHINKEGQKIQINP